MQSSWLQLLLVLLLVLGGEDFYVALSGSIDSRDDAVLRSLKDQWQHTPPSWDTSNDPCDSKWEGIICNDSRVTVLKLSSMGLSGKLSGDIAGLTALRSLDLSFNRGLTGPVSPMIGNLQNLTTLILAACNFTGNIPNEIGKLKKLSFLALNSNHFTGEIPPSLGMLSNLTWLDVADNMLSGPIPVSTSMKPGLDMLLNARHFHCNKNKFSGNLPAKLFSSEMKLIHILFDGNELSGSIPSTLGLVQTLLVLRLDRNSLSGEVPSSLQHLTEIIELNLANNQLTGPIPDLTGMTSLNRVDLSNNSFEKSEAPNWFSNIPSLTILVMECGPLHGHVPEELFSLPELREVRLKNNSFNSTLNISDSINEHLQLVDLENNQITSITTGSGYKNTLKLSGNPVCNDYSLLNDYCQNRLHYSTSYSTDYAHCGINTCPSGQMPHPHSCDCAYPYKGTLYFNAPCFSDLSNSSIFQELEQKLRVVLGLGPDSVSLQNPFFNEDDYLQVHLELFPSTGKYFSRSEIQKIGFDMSNQTFKAPLVFGPYYFIADPYPFPDGGGSSISVAVIISISVSCALLVLLVVWVGACSIWQKKRAERAIKLNKPFASWESSTKDSGAAPQLKGARCFSYNKIKNSTNNFSESNEIGSGGYGKVYKGILLGHQLVAIKRAQKGSKQGGLEFKTEIELLSGVHHKNLVSLIGFCFEQGEQMLIYEYVANGTLKDSLSGRSGVHLDWKRRLRVALSSARGLAYLHELTHTPIIHRDVKSSNILLDENLSAKVADFGLSKLVSESSNGYVSTQVKGTRGYIDPEYYLTQQLSEKSDVYSFGVVMLELVTAKEPIEKGKNIVQEVKIVMNPNDKHYGLSELMDSAILYESNVIGFRRFVDLAMQCVEERGEDRPIMSDVVKEIETILQNGMKTDPNSTSSSVTDYGTKKDAPSHLDIDTVPKKERISDLFDSSGGHTLLTKVEPK